MSDHFDLVIIGAGSGNSILDERFESWKVAIVERDGFGGTCMLRGCIPTKMLVHPADVVESARHGARVGVDAHVDAVRWADIRDRVFGRIDPIEAAGRRYRQGQKHVTVLAGDGRFSADKEMVVQLAGGRSRTITADRFVVAAGARPMIPDVPGLGDVPFETSDTIMRIDQLPSRLVILGGGFIAAELAHVFDAYGSRVTIVARGDRLLSHHDAEIAHAFTALAVDRFDVRLRSSITGVAEHRGTKLVAVQGPDGSTDRVDADCILVATGRIPNSDQLGLAGTAVKIDDDGFVVTDPTLETSVPGIYALGDIRTPLMLKHVANHEARVVQHNLLFPADPIRIEERFVPHAVFGSPQVAAVGLTEAEARDAGYDVICATRHYADSAAGWALEDTTSVAKMVADRATGRLLGGHILGPQASILVQQLVLGMRFGLTVEQIARDQMYIHPALSEVVEQALLGILEQN